MPIIYASKWTVYSRRSDLPYGKARGLNNHGTFIQVSRWLSRKSWIAMSKSCDFVELGPAMTDHYSLRRAFCDFVHRRINVSTGDAQQVRGPDSARSTRSVISNRAPKPKRKLKMGGDRPNSNVVIAMSSLLHVTTVYMSLRSIGLSFKIRPHLPLLALREGPRTTNFPELEEM